MNGHLGAGARLSVVWQDGHVEHSIDTVDHVASYMRSLVEALTMAGWHPRRLEVGLRVVPPRVVEIDVHGEVPRLDQASFAKLASVAIAACNLWAALDADAEIRLRPRLLPTDITLGAADVRAVIEPALPLPEEAPPPAPPAPLAELIAPSVPPAPRVSPPDDLDKPRLATRIIVAVVFGGLLGLFGLPRLSAQFNVPEPAPVPAAQQLPTPGSFSTEAPVVLAPTSAPPTLAPTPVPPPTPAPTSTPLPTPTAATQQRTVIPAGATDAPRVVFAERFVSPLDGWPHNPRGTAWFADGSYQLMARVPGRFVAVSTPLSGPIGDVTMSGRFRKTGGPAGGGYGFIVRSQGSALDGESQIGRYLVLEVGDRGDVGIWQRDDTRWIDVLPWTHSNAVRVGDAPNEMSVSTQANRLRFVVNGVEVANMTHGTLPTMGGVGVFVGGDLNEVSLEWLIVEAPSSVVTR